jgi:hypothetical protein
MERRSFVKGLGVGFGGFYAGGTAALGEPDPAAAEEHPHSSGAAPQDMTAVNDQIRREKFDTVLLAAMKKYNVDMWIYVMEEAVPDIFGAEDLGSTSGVFVFTNRDGKRIERAILGRRWGDSFASGTWRVDWDTRRVEKCSAYDIVEKAVLVKQPDGPGIGIEYDYRFAGLRKFVDERKPKRIALNYKLKLCPYPTSTKIRDGLSHTDFVLLTKELGPKYSAKIVSHEYVLMDYLIHKVPTEIELLKTLRREEDKKNEAAFAAVVPGVTKNREVGLTLFRRQAPGISQRGRTPGYENLVIQGGDLLAAPSQGTYAYVLRKGETEPPPEIQKWWQQYRLVDQILKETIKAGLTPRQIVQAYTPKFEAAGFILRQTQLQLATPPEDFPAFAAGFDPAKTHLCIDCHGMAKGAQTRKYENYFGPRIGSNGPEWCWDVPLPPNHHCVLEYFFYMPVASREHKDQYLFFWDHEQVLVDPVDGVTYLSPMKKELKLIRG